VRRANRLGVLVGLVVFQSVLIAAALPHDFRFFGGLQYRVLVAGAIAIAPDWTRARRDGLGAGMAILIGPWLSYGSRSTPTISRGDSRKSHPARSDERHYIFQSQRPEARLCAQHARLPTTRTTGTCCLERHRVWFDSWGPRMEDLLRNGLYALIEQP
jgi:hypothetical protein